MEYQNTLPEWLGRTEDYTVPSGRCKCWHRGGFLQKTLRELVTSLHYELLNNHYAKQPGFLQRLDPRVKLITLLGLVGLAGLTKELMVLGFIYLVTLGLMYFSKLPVLIFQKRIWLFIPLFTAIMALPGSLNIVVDGERLLTIYELAQPLDLGFMTLPASLAITRQGLTALLMLVCRVGISVSIGVLLVTTTKWASILKALRAVFVPQLFVMILEMAYRYIVLLIRVALEMFEARQVRTVGRIKERVNRQFMANTVGALFLKSMALSDEVFMAMTARGYTGEIVMLDDFCLTRVDYLWIIAVLFFVMLCCVAEFCLL